MQYKLAIEWTIFLVAVFKRLDDTMPGSSAATWIRTHLITYADDWIALWSFACSADVKCMVQQIGHLLDVLQSAGMKVNLDFF